MMRALKQEAGPHPCLEDSYSEALRLMIHRDCICESLLWRHHFMMRALKQEAGPHPCLEDSYSEALRLMIHLDCICESLLWRHHWYE